MSSTILIQRFQRLPYKKTVLLRGTNPECFHLHSTLLGGGHEEIKIGAPYSFHGLKRGNKYFANVQFTMAGRGELEYEGKTYPLESGTVFFTQIPHNHCYYLTKQHPWEFIYLTLTGSEVQRIVEEILRVSPSPAFSLSNKSLQQLYNIIASLLKESKPNIFYYSAKVYSFILGILSEKFQSAESNQIHAEVTRMQDYIYTNFSQNIPISLVTAQSGLSEHYAMRIFKQVTGRTVRQFLEEVRLNQAVNLLQYSMRTIKEIAFMVGFLDHNYFIRVFSKHFGTSPGKYRKQ